MHHQVVGVLNRSGSQHARHVAELSQLHNTHGIDSKPSVHMLMIDCQIYILEWMLREPG